MSPWSPCSFHVSKVGPCDGHVLWLFDVLHLHVGNGTGRNASHSSAPRPRVPLRPPVSLSIPIWKMGPRHLLTEAKIPGVKAAWASSTAQGQTDRQTEVPSRSTWRSPKKHRAGPGRFRESSGSQRPFLDSLSKVPPPREKQGYH